jgi:hypothetical protein
MSHELGSLPHLSGYVDAHSYSRLESEALLRLLSVINEGDPACGVSGGDVGFHRLRGL